MEARLIARIRLEPRDRERWAGDGRLPPDVRLLRVGDDLEGERREALTQALAPRCGRPAPPTGHVVQRLLHEWRAQQADHRIGDIARVYPVVGQVVSECCMRPGLRKLRERQWDAQRVPDTGVVLPAAEYHAQSGNDHIEPPHGSITEGRSLS